MAGEYDLTVAGVEEFREELLKLAPELRRGPARRALVKGAEPVLERAIAETPILSADVYVRGKLYRKRGTLRNALRIRASKDTNKTGDVGVFVNIKPLAKGAVRDFKEATGRRSSANPVDPFLLAIRAFCDQAEQESEAVPHDRGADPTERFAPKNHRITEGILRQAESQGLTTAHTPARVSNAIVFGMGKVSGIYVVTHRASGKRYVGQSIYIDRRLKDHATGKSGTGILCNAIKKYGWDAFDAAVLEVCAVDALNESEQRWIEVLGTMHPAGFNLTSGGEQYRFSDSVRRLISERTRAGLTPEICEQRASKIRGRPKTEAWKAFMSERQSKNSANISRLIALARNQSPETRAKIALSHQGMVCSSETTAKISAAKKGVKLGPRSPFTDDTRAKMSASARARWARQKLERESST